MHTEPPARCAPAPGWNTMLRNHVGAAGSVAVDGTRWGPALRALDDVALLTMMGTFRRADLFVAGSTHSEECIADILRVVPRHRWLLRRWLQVLAAEQRLGLDQNTRRYYDLKASPFFLSAARQRFSAYPFVRYGILDINDGCQCHRHVLRSQPGPHPSAHRCLKDCPKGALMPPSSIHVQLGTPAAAQEHEESIFQLYYDIFSKPPYQWPEHGETEFRRRLTRLAADATFGIGTAQANGELVGFAYGCTLRPDTRWWDGFITPVSEEVTAEREGRTFALIDFAVAEAWRGHGIGRRLHDTLLSSRPETRATLAVEPVAHEAQAIYERWGWRVVGRLRGPATDFAPEFDIMVRDLPL